MGDVLSNGQGEAVSATVAVDTASWPGEVGRGERVGYRRVVTSDMRGLVTAGTVCSARAVPRV
jgi:hypothetical protein